MPNSSIPYNYDYKSFVEEISLLNKDKDYRKQVFNSGIRIGSGINCSVEGFLGKVDNILSNNINKESFLLSILEKNKGFSKKEKNLLKHYLFSQNFIEGPHFFNALRDFINAEFKYLDLVAFKYDKNENCLRYYGGNKELDMDTIFLDNFNNTDAYINERLSIKDNSGINFYFENLYENTDGGKIVFKMQLPWGEQIIVSIKMKETLFEYNNNVLKEELERTLSIFSNTLLLDTANILLSNIRSSYKDFLTGLYNKAYLEAVTKIKKYSVVIIDIDSFKPINDSYGHNFGDKVLKKVASILKKSVKNNDKVCRTGGDEFCILVSTNDQKELDYITDRIKQNSKGSLQFNVNKCINCKIDCTSCNDSTDSSNKNNSYINVELSIGSKVYNSKNSIAELMHFADSEMYDNKPDEGKKSRVLTQVDNIEDYNLLSEIYDSVFSKMVEKGGEEKVLKKDFLDLLSKRLPLINDKETLVGMNKIINKKLESI